MLHRLMFIGAKKERILRRFFVIYASISSLPMQAQTRISIACSSLIGGNEFEIWSKFRLPGSNE
jgi:hypothetical protein